MHKDNRTQTNTVLLRLATLSDEYPSQGLIDSLIEENRWSNHSTREQRRMEQQNQLLTL